MISNIYFFYIAIVTVLFLRYVIEFCLDLKIKFDLYTIGSIILCSLLSIFTCIILYKKIAYHIIFGSFSSIITYSALSVTKTDNESILTRIRTSISFGLFWVQVLSFFIFYFLNNEKIKDDI